MKLPRLTDKQFDEVIKRLEETGRDPLKCPTCKSIPDEFGVRHDTFYRYNDEKHECDCETQILLLRHYTLANIGPQYMNLDWSTYSGPKDIVERVDTYVTEFEAYKDFGMGLEFYSPITGVGKSFAAIHVLKEVIKQGYTGYVINFGRLIKILGSPKAEERNLDLQTRLENVGILVIDDIVPPKTNAQQGFFETNLEIIVRQRTDWNMPILTTTNMIPEQIANHYPRIYSLLSAKQDRISMPGKDNRATKIFLENLKYIAAGENKPLT